MDQTVVASQSAPRSRPRFHRNEPGLEQKKKSRDQIYFYFFLNKKLIKWTNCFSSDVVCVSAAIKDAGKRCQKKEKI